MEPQKALVYEVLEGRFPGGGGGSHMQSMIFEKSSDDTINNERARSPYCTSISRIPEKERVDLYCEVRGGGFMFAGLPGIVMDVVEF